MKRLGLAGWWILLLNPVWANDLTGTYELDAVYTDAHGTVSAAGKVQLTVTGSAPLSFTRTLTTRSVGEVPVAQTLRFHSRTAKVLPSYSSNGRDYHQVEVTYAVDTRRGAAGALWGQPSEAADLKVLYYWAVDDPTTIVEWARNTGDLPFPPLPAEQWSTVEARGHRTTASRPPVVDLPLGADPNVVPPPVVDLPLGSDLDPVPPPPVVDVRKPLTLFVYGTLMRGERNNRFLRGARFLRAVQTAPQYQLWHLGSYPGLSRGTARVRGELYEVTPAQLSRVDALEATAPEGYERLPVSLAGGETAWGYVLTRPPRSARPITSGSWN